MTHYRFYRSVPVEVFARGNKLDDSWTLGIWEYSVDRPQWGLMHYNYPSQMSYGLDYANPIEAISKIEDRGQTCWYFDVGNEITVLKDDLERAFKDLGIWDEDPCQRLKEKK